MSRIEIEHSQVDRLAMDLARAPGRIQRRAPKVFEVGAYKTKRNLQRMAAGHRYLGGLASAVEYERIDAAGLDYEIGFNKGGVGSLANVAVYGTSNNAPIMGSPADALRMELPNILRHLADVAEDSVLGGDGER